MIARVRTLGYIFNSVNILQEYHVDTEVVWGKVVSVQKWSVEGRMTGDVNLLPHGVTY